MAEVVRRKGRFGTIRWKRVLQRMAAAGIRQRIQVCAANHLARRPELIQQLRHEGAAVELVECLDQCTRCDRTSFALVGGTFHYASTPEELVGEILANIDGGK